mgnify:CR=1 FL=1
MLESRGNMNKNGDFEKLIVTTDSFDDVKNLDSEIKKRFDVSICYVLFLKEQFIHNENLVLATQVIRFVVFSSSKHI